MGGIAISFFTALCFGLAAAFAALLLGSILIRIVEENRSDGDDLDSRTKLPLAFRLVRPLLPLGRLIARASLFKGLLEVLEPKLWMSGYGETLTALDFMATRIVFFLIGVAGLFFWAWQGSIYIGLLLLLLFVVYPGVWLNSKIRRRHLEILKALPNVLDLLTLSVEAGKDFLTSLRDILQRRKVDALGEELLRAFHEIQLGRKRVDALRDMSFRVRQPDLTAVVNAVIQAEELGVSIGHLLRIQGDMLRIKRFNLAEKLANEAPVKIIGPIILFIFPAVFVILIVPIGIRIAEVLM